MTTPRTALPKLGPDWPEPRLRALQVDELYGFAPSATAYSYFGALITLAVLIEIGDIGRGAVWFLWATAVTFFRIVCIVAYRRRPPGSDPESWARLIVAANFLAGVQWGVLGTILFPRGEVYLQLFTLMMIICFVAGSVTAYSAVRGAHEALSLPATIPTTIYLFFVQTGVHVYAGVMGLFFTFAIVYYARKLNRHMEEGFRLQLERDDLVTLGAVLNEKLARENRDLAHRVAVRGVSVESARERAERLSALFERSPLPHIECDAGGIVLASNGAAQRVFQLRADDLAGRPLASVLSLGDIAPGDLATAAEAESMRAEVRAADGSRTRCLAVITTLPGVEGRLPGFGVVLTGLNAAVAA